jgi:hypothetical protein
MNKGEIRILEMLVRVRQWMASRGAAFPAGPRGNELHVLVDTCVRNMERHATTQATRARRQGEDGAEEERRRRLTRRHGGRVPHRALYEARRAGGGSEVPPPA